MPTPTRLFDTLFAGSPASMTSGGRTHARPLHVEWSRSGPAGPVSWHTDGWAAAVSDAPVRVKWLLEPREMHPENYAPGQLDGFDVIYTHDPQVLEGYERARAYFLGGTRIHESWWGASCQQWDAPISIIASPKRSLPGHSLRHQLIADCPELRAYGPEYQPVESKADALLDSIVTVAIESVQSPYLFSEHLLDCLLTMNLPIYWGAEEEALKAAGFDLRGIVHCSSPAELVAAIHELSSPEARYTEWYRRMSALQANLRAALAYTCPEDNLWRLDRSLFRVATRGKVA